MISLMQNSVLFCLIFLSECLIADSFFESRNVADIKPFLSDDGSEIRSLPTVNGVETVHCRLPKGGIIQASRHKTVSQLWYVLDGFGELWLKASDGKESIVPLKHGVSVTVALGYAFQFRNGGAENLDILIVNTTKWSGPGELIPVKNHWNLRRVSPLN